MAYRRLAMSRAMSKRSPGQRLARGLLAVTVCLFGCGSEGDAQPGSGLDRNKKLNAVSAEERRTVCDWAAELFGGYGKSKMCTAQTAWPGPRNAEECSAELASSGASCAATIGTFEDCYRAFFAADACKEPVSFPMPCNTVRACYATK